MIRPTHIAALERQYRAAGGPWDQPSLDSLLTDATGIAQPSALVVDGDRRIGAGELNELVADAAGHLLERDVTPGDVVTWQFSNSAAALVALRACWRIGAIAAPIHHSFSVREVTELHAQLRPKLVLNDSEIGGSREPMSTPWMTGDSLAAVLFTSGSSGVPKGVLHTQHTLAYKARTMAAVHGLTADDVVLMPAPLAHISGLLNGVTLPGSVAFTSVLMRRWDPEAALTLIEDEHVSFMVGPPTFFVAIMQSAKFSPERVQSLRLISSGGAGVSPEFVARATDTLQAVVKRTYGSTEAPTVATSRPTDDIARARRHDGRALDGVELRTNETGELLVRGPEVCVGYLDVQQTAAAFDSDGWFATGDLGTFTDGWLTITGRIADIIIRGGENISTAEVETALTAHPSITEAIVVGYPDGLMGERVCAYLVATSEISLAVIQEWFKERGLAKYKTPERIVQVSVIPMLASGKPDRAALRALAAGHGPESK